MRFEMCISILFLRKNPVTRWARESLIGMFFACVQGNVDDAVFQAELALVFHCLLHPPRFMGQVNCSYKQTNCPPPPGTPNEGGF